MQMKPSSPVAVAAGGWVGRCPSSARVMVDAIADLMGEGDGEDEAGERERAAFGLAIPSVKGLLGPSISRMVPRQRERE